MYKRHIRLRYVTDVNWPKRPGKNALLGLGKNSRSSRIRHPNALPEKTWGDAAHGLEKYNGPLTLG